MKIRAGTKAVRVDPRGWMAAAGISTEGLALFVAGTCTEGVSLNPNPRNLLFYMAAGETECHC